MPLLFKKNQPVFTESLSPTDKVIQQPPALKQEPLSLVDKAMLDLLQSILLSIKMTPDQWVYTRETSLAKNMFSYKHAELSIWGEKIIAIQIGTELLLMNMDILADHPSVVEFQRCVQMYNDQAILDLIEKGQQLLTKKVST